jgi:hypothetical protein
MNPIDLTALVGLTVAEAERIARAQGYTLRVLARDGVWLPATADLREDRVNVEVAAGKVVRADIG